MKKIFNKIYHHTVLGKVLIYVYHNIIKRFISDKNYIENRYKKSIGKPLNLKDPKTLNEKINWLKLYQRTPLHTQCADKYAVRAYIKEKIGDSYLIPLHFKTENPKDIVPNNIPETPCIIKTNHDSGGGIFVFYKKSFDYKKAQNELKHRLNKNYYHNSREWQYKNIKPCILIEKLLLDSNGKIPKDYKLHCLNGKVQMIQVDIDRGTENHYRNWYTTKWERENYHWSSDKGNGKFTVPAKFDVEKPSTLNDMISLSQVLSKDFDYVRVDWYDVEGKLYFGELTFHHDSGYSPIIPEKWDLILGERLKLN